MNAETALPGVLDEVTQPKTRYELNNSENLKIGALGGTMETLIQMPLVTMKICVQEGRPYPKSFKAWYRGVWIIAGSIAPVHAIQLFSNGVITKMLRNGSDRDLSLPEVFLSASIAGSISALFYGPADLLVIQQQKLNKSLFGTLSVLTQKFGKFAVFRGLGSSVIREALYSCGYIALAPIFSKVLRQHSDYFVHNHLKTAIVSSTIAGIIAAILTHPIDTVKTCIQADMERKLHPNLASSFPQLYKQGGIKSLYRGFIFRTMRLSGAFFIINNLREYWINKKSGDLYNDDAFL
eukprot:TRINITY_DN418_c0_g1_i2.p1 TRINITY_DN418_c0_g1~~TRINITY_DN418_c0_g1_i2.p1  ORF type:complete len:294 (+),score=46.73 TRINITY_DN418_c0_g1_i2:84-965(+)